MSGKSKYVRPGVKVTFGEDHPNHGLVVSGRRLNLGELRRFEELSAMEFPNEGDREARYAAENEMIGIIFGADEETGAGWPGVVREWNMAEADDDDTPVPLPTAETFEEYDQLTLVAIMNGFVRSSQPRAVSRPLERPSADTPSSVEESMRMEPPSTLPPS